MQFLILYRLEIFSGNVNLCGIQIKDSNNILFFYFVYAFFFYFWEKVNILKTTFILYI